jgi:hypothetical protein
LNTCAQDDVHHVGFIPAGPVQNNTKKPENKCLPSMGIKQQGYDFQPEAKCVQIENAVAVQQEK